MELIRTSIFDRMLSQQKGLLVGLTIFCLLLVATLVTCFIQTKILKPLKQLISYMNNQMNPKQQKVFKVVVIHEIDRLSANAQASLRRTMETYMPTCRIIANAESLSKVIAPLRSRCL